ncbi:PDDEXK-like family protein [Paraburkholderia sp. RL17-337-BIB-A]|uniref:PDDEXK-like family protein n=1 Tax=Paraburkholderia sp. RL17-337-BIB-A TaxID=3031636 RepID=UPI0038B8A973
MANFWRAAGLGYDELRNSQALAWILDRFGDHGQGSAILERLVELAGRQQPIAVTPETVRRVDYSTRTESQPLGDRESRVDIEIESPRFLIFIEVKVRAPETSDQLKRYVELARQKAAGRPSVVVFLTPDGRLPVDGKLHGTIIPLSWRQVSNILTAYVSGERADSFSGRIFLQFAAHARTLAR